MSDSCTNGKMQYNISDILGQKKSIAIVGLGYVGINLATEFAKKVKVIGYDVDISRIDLYQQGIDLTGEIEKHVLEKVNIQFTTNPSSLKMAQVIIIAVPTPINDDCSPDLSLVIEASRTVGEYLQKGTVVIYESTVYPGVTENICVPIIERQSNLKCGIDFSVGYSPERINPGDKIHRVNTITKIVSGINIEATDYIKQIYELIIEDVYPVSNIKTAEAIKVVENTQRDVNIAFMNEVSMIMNQFGINTKELVEGMNTKWNSLKFTPGLVGGHCIGIDPYYLSYAAEKIGCKSELIQLSRVINENMSSYIIDLIRDEYLKNGIELKGSRIAILGVTFKENCPDTRNSKVFDIINILRSKEVDVVIVDEWADTDAVFKATGLHLSQLSEIKNVSCVVVAVAHEEFQHLKITDYKKMFGNGNILIDVKNLYDDSIMINSGITYKSL